MTFKNLSDLFSKFSSEEVCREYLAQQRWNGKPVCPHCGVDGKVYVIEGGKRYKCADKHCRQKFSVTVGTIFENSNIPLRTWFAAIYLCTAHKKGISSLQLHRDIGVTQKTAWFMLHRIREMLRETSPVGLQNTVEVDETYVGGSEKNKHASKKLRKYAERGRSIAAKTPVLGLVERGGMVYARKLDGAKEQFIFPIIQSQVKPGATIVTDCYPAYALLDPPWKSPYKHLAIDHSRGKYVDGQIHTNTIEGFWSLFKRGIVGIYHYVSRRHLNAYCNEFAYRYNTRKITDPQRFKESLKQAQGRRLKYRELTHPDYVEK